MRDQPHVAFVDRRPAANGRAVHAEAFFEGILGQLVDRIRNVLPQAWQVGEAEDKNFGSVFLRKLQDSFCICHLECSFKKSGDTRKLISDTLPLATAGFQTITGNLVNSQPATILPAAAADSLDDFAPAAK